MGADKSIKQSLALFAVLLEYPNNHPLHQFEVNWNSFGELNAEILQHIQKFREGISELSLTALQELYTRTFDLQMICYPYVGYHLFGESYKRGAFMSQLKERYQRYGFSAGNELPDHLGMLLRFISNIDDEEESVVLIEDGLLPALKKMKKAFDGTQNPYGFLLIALDNLLNLYLKKAVVPASYEQV